MCIGRNVISVLHWLSLTHSTHIEQAVCGHIDGEERVQRGDTYAAEAIPSAPVAPREVQLSHRSSPDSLHGHQAEALRKASTANKHTHTQLIE